MPVIETTWTSNSLPTPYILSSYVAIDVRERKSAHGRGCVTTTTGESSMFERAFLFRL